MTGNGYQRLAMRTCSIPYDRKDDMLRHAEILQKAIKQSLLKV